MGHVVGRRPPRGTDCHASGGVAVRSYIALSDGINTNEALNAAVTAYNAQSANTYHLRSPQEIADYFSGLDVVEPGVVATSAWRPDATLPADDAVDVAMCGVARKR
ncbi:SAM-dependent methyltransferase [Streptomyces sp. KL116D]|uniref:SAM-dependent methyltransferase n=1 Tax=Streptomyces sp. KL116D TaxID=3045152 RepID=UPI003557E64C